MKRTLPLFYERVCFLLILVFAVFYGNAKNCGSESSPKRVKWVALKKPNMEAPAGSVIACAFSPDGGQVARVFCSFTDYECRVEVWSVKNDKRIALLPTGKRIEISELAFSPCGRLLVTGGVDDPVRIWETDTWRLQETLKFPETTSATMSVAFSSDGKLLATGDLVRRVIVWNNKKKKWKVSQILKMTGLAWTLAFSRDGSMLASTTGGHVAIWDLKKKSEIWSFDSHEHPINKRVGISNLCFLPDNKSLVTAGADEKIRVWDTTKKKQLREIDPKIGEIWPMDVSPDGNTVAVGNHLGKKSSVKLWDLRTNKELAVLGPFNSGLKVICFSPDSKTLATGTLGPKGQLRLWRLEESTGK